MLEYKEDNYFLREKEENQEESSEQKIDSKKKNRNRLFDDNEAQQEDDEDNSDEEDEEDDEDEAALVREGFIVDHVDKEEEEEEEEEDETEEDINDALDEDDLELIAENTGLLLNRQEMPSEQKQSVFRRLKKTSKHDNDYSLLDEAEEALIPLTKRLKVDSKHKRDIMKRRTEKEFDSEDESIRLWDHPEKEDEEKYEEEEEEEDEEEEDIDELSPSNTYGMQLEAVSLITSIFGDVGVVLEILNRRCPRNEEYETVENDLKQPTRMQQLAEGAHEVEFGEYEYLTHFDDVIRTASIPERYALQFGIHHVTDSSEDRDLEGEVHWIMKELKRHWNYEKFLTAEKLLAKYTAAFGDRSQYYVPAQQTVKEDIQEKVKKLLNWIIYDYLEIPYIWHHRRHLISPPLTYNSCWIIFDLHKEWTRLMKLSLHWKNIVEKLLTSNSESISELQKDLLKFCFETIKNFETEQDINDIRTYVHSTYPQVCNIQEVPTKRRASLAPDALSPLKKLNLPQHWSEYILSSKFFGDNLLNARNFAHFAKNRIRDPNDIDIASKGTDNIFIEDTKNVKHTPPVPPVLPGRGFDGIIAWLSSFRVGPFSTGHRIFEALLAYEARQLAINPVVRQILRAWFLKHASISVYPKTENYLMQSQNNWAALTLFRKPINELQSASLFDFDELYEPFNMDPQAANSFCSYEQIRDKLFERERQSRESTAFLDILKAEAQGTIIVLIHPLDGEPENVPWKVGKDNAEISLASAKLARCLYTTKDMNESDEKDQAVLQSLLSELSGLYCSDNVSSSEWVEHVQLKILQRLLVKELLPLYRREVRSLLQRNAERQVALLARDELLWRLCIKPFQRKPLKKKYQQHEEQEKKQKGEEEKEKNVSKNENEFSAFSNNNDECNVDDDDEDFDDEDKYNNRYKNSLASYNDDTNFFISEDNSDKIRAMGIVLERLNPGIRTHVLVANRNGIPIQYIKLDRLIIDDTSTSRKSQSQLEREKELHEQDLIKLKRFIQKRKAFIHVAIIGTGDLKAQKLHDILNEILQDTRQRFELVYGSLEVPRIFSTSEVCPKDYVEAYTYFGCQALGLCRMAQNPLAAYLELWCEDTSKTPNLLLQLKYHPLQIMLPRDLLESALLQAAQIAVAHVGVDLNEIKQWPHLQGPLQFIPGLGPRKAKVLLNLIELPGYKFQDREHICTFPVYQENANTSELLSKVFQPNILTNCKSFFKISTVLAFHVDASDPLACTRVHSENYHYAYKMASDALENVSGSSIECVLSVLANSACLDELDLEEYSIILNEQGNQRLLPYLEAIRNELKTPYRDFRFAFSSVSGSRLFCDLIQEDAFEFQPGCELVATVKDSRLPKILRLVLQPSNIKIQVEDLHNFIRQESNLQGYKKQSWRGSATTKVSLQNLLPVEAVISCRLKSINTKSFTADVFLSRDVAGSFIIDNLKRDCPGLFPQNLTVTSIWSLLNAPYSPNSDIRNTESSRTYNNFSADKKRVASHRRRIVHARYRNTTSISSITSELRNSKVGDALFTQSTERVNELLLYIKITHSPLKLKAIAVQELNKPPTGELGKVLQIGSQAFSNLDQILCQFVEPLKLNLNEIYSFEKYRSGETVDAVEKALLASQEKKFLTTQTPSIEWGVTIDINYPSHHPGVRFHLIAIPPQQQDSKTVVIRDSIYVSPEGFKLWNHKERSLQRLINWWKTDGYFQRKRLVTEYNASKKRNNEVSK